MKMTLLKTPEKFEGKNLNEKVCFCRLGSGENGSLTGLCSMFLTNFFFNNFFREHKNDV